MHTHVLYCLHVRGNKFHVFGIKQVMANNFDGLLLILVAEPEILWGLDEMSYININKINIMQDYKIH